MGLVRTKPAQSLCGVGEKLDIRSAIPSRLPEELTQFIRLVIVKTKGKPEIWSYTGCVYAGAKSRDSVHLSGRRSCLDEDTGAVEFAALLREKRPEFLRRLGSYFQLPAVVSVNVVLSKLDQQVFEHGFCLVWRKNSV